MTLLTRNMARKAMSARDVEGPRQVALDRPSVDLIGPVNRRLAGRRKLREAFEGEDLGPDRAEGAVESQALSGPPLGGLAKPRLRYPEEGYGPVAPCRGHTELLGPPAIGAIQRFEPLAQARGPLQPRDPGRRVWRS